MKRYDGLWERIATFEALYAAYEMARAKRHFRPEIMGIGSRIEDVIHELLLDLETGEWRPQKCYDFECRKEVKRRIINAPTFRDRILHRAIVAEVQPLFEKKMIFDSYASRPGKGTHAAVRRVQHFLRGAGLTLQAIGHGAHISNRERGMSKPPARDFEHSQNPMRGMTSILKT